MDTLTLALLGSPQIVYHRAPLTGWALRKSQALLAYVAVTGRPHSREALAGLLWPDCTEADARGNLRKVVAELRRRLPCHVVATRSEVAFDRSSPYWLDVQAFERTIHDIVAARSGVTQSGAVSLAEAVALYRGAFLSGLAVHRAPDFEQWVLIEQERLQQLLLQALHALACYHAAQQPAVALEHLDHLLALEAAHEEAQRLKMWLLAAGGQRLAALQQYTACCTALQTLGAEPGTGTVALYERIRTAAELPISLHAPPALRPTPCCLPAPLLPLVGREAELAEIRTRLRDPACRLLTLAGPAGSGKTHLAIEALSDAALAPAAGVFSLNLPGAQHDPFVYGVSFVPLASVPDIDALAAVLARILDLSLAGQALPHQEILAAARGRRSLLVLDGFEHLLAAAGLIVDLLEAAPTLKILVTSRARLDVEGEHLLAIQGLPCPEHVPARGEALAPFPAIRLFVAGARQIQPRFEGTGAELLDVARICHYVGGLPLAILLAASWIGILTPADIAAELQAGGSRGLDLLQRDDGRLPARRRSMRAVYDRSWELLSARERQVLAGLSALAAGFTAGDAHQAAGASLRELRALVNWSLLRREATGRYVMDEMLCHYVAEQSIQSLSAIPYRHASEDSRSCDIAEQPIKVCVTYF
ncbi:MAG: hypothetical protein JXA93_22510 [Anaerolineae bacterium]|nr:hypothetical protein [Anaerolineae bacterium]